MIRIHYATDNNGQVVDQHLCINGIGQSGNEVLVNDYDLSGKRLSSHTSSKFNEIQQKVYDSKKSKMEPLPTPIAKDDEGSHVVEGAVEIKRQETKIK
ncbi:MAG: hypothetical protein JST26_11680 [Bacteroidetes bacterium]|nr:hypothetical protein [Bacteroidota bacterium]